LITKKHLRQLSKRKKVSRSRSILKRDDKDIFICHAEFISASR
jgi:hypothetical protein